MKLRRLKIKNFRSLVNIDVPIFDNTVIIGENNAGKTAMISAINKALNWKTQSTNFSEYDYHMVNNSDTPQNCEGIEIELWFKENHEKEWSESLLRDLADIKQLDPFLNINYIGFRIKSHYEGDEEISSWDFLDLNNQEPLTGSKTPRNLKKFLDYIQIFYLSSLRDRKYEFSSKSRYWGKIVRNLKINDDTKKDLIDKLADINDTLLNCDSRIEDVIEILDSSKEIMELGEGQRTGIRALPLKPWELMSKSEIVVKSAGNETDFPLSIHGHGIQSLSVIYLFKAFIDVFLRPRFNRDTEAIMALEEPEAHLHPQAIRALATNLKDITGQKILSSHSPYFIQEINFRDILMFRKNNGSSSVLYIKPSYDLETDFSHALSSFCENNPKYNYDQQFSILSLKGSMTDKEYRKLLQILPEKTSQNLTTIKKESQLYLSEEDIFKLDTYAKRVRGEILFARGWILCEGQSDYLITRFFADIYGKPLDPSGIAVIDFQNNGSPGAFVALAEQFQIPWVMYSDNDAAGKNFITQIKKRGLSDERIGELVKQLPGEGTDLEKFLVKNGFYNEYLEVIKDNNIAMDKKEGENGFEDELIEKLRKMKPAHATYLIKKLKDSEVDEARIPAFFKEIIDKIFLRMGKNEE